MNLIRSLFGMPRKLDSRQVANLVDKATRVTAAEKKIIQKQMDDADKDSRRNPGPAIKKTGIPGRRTY